MWVRGLKLIVQCCPHRKIYVAPYVGAWIETYSVAYIMHKHGQSHPMWVRGLKHVGWGRPPKHAVAPYVGAWIETRICSSTRPQKDVAPYVGAWIET